MLVVNKVKIKLFVFDNINLYVCDYLNGIHEIQDKIPYTAMLPVSTKETLGKIFKIFL